MSNVVSVPNLSLAVALAALLSGCKDPATEQTPSKCFPVPGEVCDDETGGTDGGETGGGETGGGETGGGEPTMLGPGECVFNEGQGKVGLQYNCFGELHTSMDLVITGLFPTCESLFDDDAWCSDDFYFDYHSQVVACCGEYDIELKPAYQMACINDLYAQLCRSLSEHLAYLVENGDFKAYSGKGAELQTFVATHQLDCFESFSNNNTAELPFVETHWALSESFGLLTDVVFHIDAGTRIDGVNQPDFDEEWPTCDGAGYNDDTLFGNTGQQPLGGIAVAVNLASPVQAELSGPVVFGGAVGGTTTLGNACAALGCPQATFSYDRQGPNFGLEAFALFGHSFAISNGQYSIIADRVQIQLYGQAAGTQVLGASGAPIGYEIPPGAAWFFVSGIAGDTANRFMAMNATSIWVTPGARGTWDIDAFLLEHADGNNDRWTLMLEASQWR